MPGRGAQPSGANDGCALIDRNFVDGWFQFRASRMPVDSEFFSLIGQYYAARKSAEEQSWGPSFGKRLRRDFVEQYNRECDVAERTMARAIASRSLDSDERERARRIAAARLSPNATLIDFLRLDPFYEQLPLLAIDMSIVEGRRRAETVANDSDTYLHKHGDVHHAFFHRPQQSAYLFLHEMIVGHWLNQIHFDGAVPRRGELGVSVLSKGAIDLTGPYYPLAGYFTKGLVQLTGIPMERLLPLHFATTQRIDAALPIRVRQLLAITCQVYWYLELFLTSALAEERGKKNVQTASTLSVLLALFALPSMHRLLDDDSLRLRSDASRIVDAALVKWVLDTPKPATSVSDFDVFATLGNLVHTIWVAR
jgi:hypothetical protein